MKVLLVLILLSINTVFASWTGIESLSVEDNRSLILDAEAAEGETISAAQLNKKLEAIVSKSESLYQTKFLSSSVSGNTILHELTFRNLEAGKTYRLSGQIRMYTEQTGTWGLEIKEGSNPIGYFMRNTSGGNGDDYIVTGINVVFESTGGDITFETGGQVFANIGGSLAYKTTFITLEEINYISTTKWD